MKENKVSDQEFVSVTNRIINKVAAGYTFGIYDKDDIAQEIRLLAWEAMQRYDGKHALYQFLLIHVTNRLNTLKRDKWYRATCPCLKCDKCEEGKTKHRDKMYCEQFLDWKKRNARKANLASPPTIPDNYDKELDSFGFDSLELSEILDKIDEEMPAELRGIYLKSKSGVKISEIDKNRLLVFLKGLFDEA